MGEIEDKEVENSAAYLPLITDAVGQRCLSNGNGKRTPTALAKHGWDELGLSSKP